MYTSSKLERAICSYRRVHISTAYNKSSILNYILTQELSLFNCIVVRERQVDVTTKLQIVRFIIL